MPGWRWLLFSGLDVRLADWVLRKPPHFSSTLPPLPSVQQIDAELRRIHSELADSGEGASVALYCEGAGRPGARWRVGVAPNGPHAPHTENVPAGGIPFDDGGAANRLRDATRDCGFR
jgi:hypothetical protein